MPRFIRLGVTTLVAMTIALVSVTYFVSTQLAKQNALTDVLAKLSTRAYDDDVEYVKQLPEAYWPEKAKALPKEAKSSGNGTTLTRAVRPFDFVPQNLTFIKKDVGFQIPADFAKRPPQAIIMGFAKCGTTAIIEFLALHPKIVILDFESDYFCDRVYPKYDLRWYVSQMPPSYPDQITIEKSPCYIVEHDAHIRLAAYNTSMKLIVLVRHPITRLLSTFAHYRSTEKYWGKTGTSIENKFFDKKKNEWRTANVLKFSEYASHFEHLLKYFPREQILILDGDKLVTDPFSQLRRAEAFLGLEHYLSEKDIYYDEKKKFYCMRQRLISNEHCFGNHKGRQHEELTPEFRQRLQEFLKPHNEKFFDVVGERFEGWDQ